MKTPKQYLSDHGVSEFLKSDADMIFVDEKDAIEVAFKKLVEHKILAMPVYDMYSGEFKGLIGLVSIYS
jgi:CBS-domain-containing membrane protein